MIKPTSIVINRYESNINIHTFTKRPQGHIYENTGTQEAKQLIDYIIDGVQWLFYPEQTMQQPSWPYM
jgi:hypothetical protein